LAPRALSPFLQFDVVDTGVGMTQEQVARLFQPFTQADTSTARKHGGTGLGLTISKRFAGMLGGDIAVIDTKEGVGTRFRLTLATGPLEGVKMIEDPMSATVVVSDDSSGHTASHECGTAPAEAGGMQTEARSAPAAQLDCRILLVEDGPDNQRLIAHVLKRAGAEVTVTENGKLALETALAARDERNPFDVILMDMQMPVMDGYEATRRLRQEGYTNPIIALTAHAMTGDREKCVEAGCNDYATKPIDRRKLIEAIHAHRERMNTSSEPQVSRAEVASAGS
jgi:CheY-like chemotaxis protein